MDNLVRERAILYFRMMRGGVCMDAIALSRVSRIEREMVQARANQFLASAARRGAMLAHEEAERRARLDLFGVNAYPADSLWVD